MDVEPSALLGSWRLERRIVDRPIADPEGRRLPPRFGRVSGTLTLTPGASGPETSVTWFEQGTLTWSGQRLPVTRRLLVRRGRRHDDGAAWTVCFADGRVFHEWRPGAPVVHPCADDTYRGLVDVDPSLTELRILWDVTGPGKDRRLFTRCTRR